MVNVAVPSVIGSYGVGQTQAQLLLSGFFAMNSTGLLASSWMVARFGQREVFQGSLLVFGSGGLLCFVAPTFEFLVLGRLVQGLAAGFLQPLIMLVLVQVFPLEKRGLAMAMFTMGVTAAVGIGPAVGGVIIEAYQWQLIFLAPLPFACLAAILGFLFLPGAPRQSSPSRFDWLGFALVNTIVFCWFTLLGNGQRWGWSSDVALGFVATIVAAGAVFYYRNAARCDFGGPLPFSEQNLRCRFRHYFLLRFWDFGDHIRFPDLRPIGAKFHADQSRRAAAAGKLRRGRDDAVDGTGHRHHPTPDPSVRGPRHFGGQRVRAHGRRQQHALLVHRGDAADHADRVAIDTADDDRTTVSLPADQMQRGAGLANFAVILVALMAPPFMRCS